MPLLTCLPLHFILRLFKKKIKEESTSNMTETISLKAFSINVFNEGGEWSERGEKFWIASKTHHNHHLFILLQSLYSASDCKCNFLFGIMFKRLYKESKRGEGIIGVHLIWLSSIPIFFLPGEGLVSSNKVIERRVDYVVKCVSSFMDQFNGAIG